MERVIFSEVVTEDKVFRSSSQGCISIFQRDKQEKGLLFLTTLSWVEVDALVKLSYVTKKERIKQ